MTTDQQDILHSLRTATYALRHAIELLNQENNKENRADVTQVGDLSPRVLQKMLNRIKAGSAQVQEYWEKEEI